MRNPIDTKELLALVADAGPQFDFAAERFRQMSALFASLAKSMTERSDARELALLGEDLCDDMAGVFAVNREKYELHAERFSIGGAHE
jgi:hypothetical protein